MTAPRPGEQVRIGLVAPDDATEVRRLEQRGVDSLWVGGHVASPNPSPEAVVWLARLVEQTERTTIGTATLLLALYPPAVLAKQLADLDRASGGRLAIGVGVGGEYESDFAAAEVPRGERGARTDEAIDLLRRFWTADPVTHHGAHHAFDGVRIHPAPTQQGGPPIIVSGRQPVAMRRAARAGDGWMPYLYSPERYADSVARIRAEADHVGRDLTGFEWCAYVFVSLDDDGEQARRRALSFFGGTYGDDYDRLVDRVACVGDVARVTERLRAFVSAGARHLILVPIGDDRSATVDRLLAEVTPSIAEG